MSEPKLLPAINSRCLFRQKDGMYFEVFVLEVSPTAKHIKLLRVQGGPKGNDISEWIPVSVFWDLFQEELLPTKLPGPAQSPREKQILEDLGFGEDR